MEENKKVDGWNWGAFFLTWIWGLGNGTYIALLALVPILNLGVAIYLGVYGSSLAWKNKQWYDEEDFIRTQRKWAIAGFATVAVMIAVTAVAAAGRINARKQSDEMAQRVYETVLNSSEAREIIENPEEYINLGKSGVEIGNELVSESHTIMIKDGQNAYTVSAEIEDGEITGIRINKMKTSEQEVPHIISID